MAQYIFGIMINTKCKVQSIKPEWTIDKRQNTAADNKWRINSYRTLKMHSWSQAMKNEIGLFLVLTIFNEGAYFDIYSIRPSILVCLIVNSAPIHSWDQPVLSNEGSFLLKETIGAFDGVSNSWLTDCQYDGLPTAPFSVVWKHVII